MWRDQQSGQVVSRHDQVRALRPNVSFPAALTDAIIAAHGFDAIGEGNKPTVMEHQSAVRGDPVQSGGAWVFSWTVRDWSAEEIAANKAAAKAAKWEAIKAKRDSLSDNGGYLVDGKWFHSDGKSKTQQLSLFIMGAGVPAVQWKTMDGSFVAMTQALAAAIFSAAATQDMAIFAAAEQHKAAMEAAPDPSTYDFSAGWPATYQAVAL